MKASIRKESFTSTLYSTLRRIHATIIQFRVHYIHIIKKLMCDSAEAYINIVLNNFQNSFHLPLCFIYIESQLPTKRQQYSHAHSQCNLFHDRKPLFFVVAFITSYIHYKMEKKVSFSDIIIIFIAFLQNDWVHVFILSVWIGYGRSC